MRDMQDMDTLGKLELMEWLGSADNWVSMERTDLEAGSPAADGFQRPESLQRHHLDFHRL